MPAPEPGLTLPAMQGEIEEVRGRGRARARRLARMKARGLALVRPACLSCTLLALLWILGLPSWTIVAAGAGLVGLALVARLAARGRTVR